MKFNCSVVMRFLSCFCIANVDVLRNSWHLIRCILSFQTLDELPLEAESVERGYSLSSDSTGLPKIHGLPTSTMYSSGSSDSYTASPKNPKSRKSSHSGELQPHLYADSNGSGHAYMPGLYPTVDF